MTFPLSSLCDLLNKLDNNRAKSSNTDTIQSLDARTVVAWYNNHDEIIPRRGPATVAFLSCLFPERRPDRVFGLRERRLEAIIQRAQCLGSTRMKDLQNWRTKGSMDFASCVERVMSTTDNEPRPGPNVTLEEIDEILDRIAATSSFSSASLRERVNEKYGGPIHIDESLSRIFRVSNSSEAKWMVRMLLKDYSPVHVPEMLAMQQFHFLLPDLLRFQSSLEAAVKLLGEPTISRMPYRAAKDAEGPLREIADSALELQVGVMVARPAHGKARSIKHCCQLAGLRRMSVERKYDGEYCQIHIDLNNPRHWIKIFSKSGKDSTNDRIELHRPLRDSMKLDTIDCKIKRQCILEGELLVWNDNEKRIEPFHKIRKHVQRSGRSLGTSRDSPVDLNEHLMIMLYDILLLDNTVCIRESHDKRRRLLQFLIKCTPGRVDIGTRQIIDFSSFDAPEVLSEIFARAIVRRWEGFVLKGSNDTYFSFNGTKSFIKLKKDYIPGLGDTADFAIVGGRHDAKDEQEIGIGKLWWTSFSIGCLENKDEVCRFNAKPRFHIIDMVGRHGIPKDNILYLNRNGYFERVPFATSVPEFDVRFDHGRQLQPAELFKRPFVVELMGAGFDKPANARYFALRFPRVLKIHEDRSFKDTISFEELQEVAKRCGEVPEDSGSEETRWLRRLGRSDYLVEESRPGSPSDDSNPAPLSETAGVDSYDRICWQSTRQLEKVNTGGRKRTMASEALPPCDSATKRLRLD